MGQNHYKRLLRVQFLDHFELHQFHALSQCRIREDKFLEGLGWNATLRVVLHEGMSQTTLVLSRLAIDGIDQVSEDDASEKLVERMQHCTVGLLVRLLLCSW